MLDTAVILAGGKGLRLGPETLDKPKAMVRLLERPIIDWIILWLKKNGLRRIIVSVDHKKEVIMEYLGDGAALGVELVYNDHSGANETGDAFRRVLENKKLNLPEIFMALNGDQITDLPVKDMWVEHKRHDPITTILTCPVRIPYGILDITDDNVIEMFREKPTFENTFMNTGIYIFNRSILPHLPRRGSIEKETFAKLAQMGKLRAYKYRGFFTTINDHKDLAAAQALLQNTGTELL